MLSKGSRHKGRRVGLRPGKGWLRRNFITEVYLPSLFSRRHGTALRPKFPVLSGDQICLTWIGHASFLVSWRELNILIDPIWSLWLKVVKRLRHPGIRLDNLPAIDLVLVTHAHFDHLDRKTLRKIAAAQPIIVPDGVGALVHGLGFNRVEELKPWESVSMGEIQVTLTPCHHWGARVLRDTYRGFGGFHLSLGSRTLFHCGDSAYFDGFRQIGEHLPTEIALLPIGSYEPPSKREVHMNPEQAVQAFRELKAKYMVPMHYGSFRLSYEPPDEPVRRLRKEVATYGLENSVKIMNEGIPMMF
ncbi:MAG: MBL fold metallo-hydrolase [Verrucomicrobia bacterium]|nr:MBL fold metallo-hydrolase [Verrucomicrobiota bacterium]